MDAVGQKLKSAREAKGLSIEEVSKMTKLSEKSLIALENDRYEELPAAPYIKGFVKLYAQSVGLDPTQVLEDFRKNQVGETKQVLVLEKDKGGEVPHLWEILAALILKGMNSLYASIRRLVQACYVFSVQFIRKVHPKVWLAMGGVLILIILIKWIFPISLHKSSLPPAIEKKSLNQPAALIQPTTPVSSEEISHEDVAVAPEPVHEKPAKTSVPVQTSQSLSTQTSKSSLILIAHAKETVWMRVKCDGQRTFEGSLKKGSVQTWKADQFFILRVGNPKAIEFTLDGKELGPMGVSGGKIRDVRLAKDGWHVRD